ncbi:MAG: hypothetical protein DRN66_01380 [Candidatus Nanohalarchaeota archaeon]|nr:MAG: hypothetical protein DRN66_01380 [Candidatus Nanohaloarchaeota archaeon]
MNTENITNLLNQTNASLLNETVSGNNAVGFLQNPYLSLLWDNIAIILIFIIFVYLAIKMLAFAKKIIIVALVSAAFPFILHFLNSSYIASFDNVLKFSALGCILFVIYSLAKPILSILRRLFKNKK